MVATAPGNNSSDLTDFGANDWLIEEMFEAYSSDPNSVDPAWRAFFAARAASQADGIHLDEAERRQLDRMLELGLDAVD